MLYLLDTCVVSDFVKGDTNTVATLKQHSPHQLEVSIITVMGIEYGLEINPAKAKKIRPIIDSLLNQINSVDFTAKEAKIAASIRSQLKAKGQPIGAYDILIAATARGNNLILVTSNTAEFNRIEQLTCENWR